MSGDIVPEASSVTLLGLAGLALALRRRRVSLG
ncbi:MAG: PEP-CTERM sorting domain-containing protein [Luteolibacter sp.]